MRRFAPLASLCLSISAISPNCKTTRRRESGSSSSSSLGENWKLKFSGVRIGTQERGVNDLYGRASLIFIGQQMFCERIERRNKCSGHSVKYMVIYERGGAYAYVYVIEKKAAMSVRV